VAFSGAGLNVGWVSGCDLGSRVCRGMSIERRLTRGWDASVASSASSADCLGGADLVATSGAESRLRTISILAADGTGAGTTNTVGRAPCEEATLACFALPNAPDPETRSAAESILIVSLGADVGTLTPEDGWPSGTLSLTLMETPVGSLSLMAIVVPRRGY
jgi:hypothetical protein